MRGLERMRTLREEEFERRSDGEKEKAWKEVGGGDCGAESESWRVKETQ